MAVSDRASRELATCRGVDNPGKTADQAIRDAVALAGDVRDLDTRQAWGRLQLWAQKDPERLVAACFALAVMLPVEDRTVGQLLAWTNPLEQNGKRARQPRGGYEHRVAV
jgi:hypothetical protein